MTRLNWCKFASLSFLDLLVVIACTRSRLQTCRSGTSTAPARARQRAPTRTCICTQSPCSATPSGAARTSWCCVRRTSTTNSRQVGLWPSQPAIGYILCKTNTRERLIFTVDLGAVNIPILLLVVVVVEIIIIIVTVISNYMPKLKKRVLIKALSKKIYF